MGDHYGDVRVQLGRMKSLGEDAGKEDVDPDEEMPLSSPSASPDPTGCITAVPGTDALSADICKQKGKRSSKNPCGKPLQGFPAHAVKNFNSPLCDQTLHIKGTGKILQGKSAESNGNYVGVHESSNTQEPRCEDDFKLSRKRRPVTVDTSKAKTSLEALKLSIKELQWKEKLVNKWLREEAEDDLILGRTVSAASRLCWITRSLGVCLHKTLLFMFFLTE